jgi:hypothetical protein
MGWPPAEIWEWRRMRGREVEDHRRGEMRETEKGEDKVGEEWLGAWMRF